MKTIIDSSGKYVAQIAGAPDSSSIIIAEAVEAQPSSRSIMNKLKAKFT